MTTSLNILIRILLAAFALIFLPRLARAEGRDQPTSVESRRLAWRREIFRVRSAELARGMPCNLSTANDAQGAAERLGWFASIPRANGCDWQHPIVRGENTLTSSEPRREHLGDVASLSGSGLP